MLAVMSACKKQELPVYTGGYYVQFLPAVKDAAKIDTLSVSFFFYPGQPQVQIAMPVELIGLMPGEDLHYKVQIDTPTTASADQYSMAQEFVFRKGRTTDTAFITIINKPELATVTRLIAVKIIPGDDVQPGATIFARRLFWISDMVSKPTWWDANMDNVYLGKYTEKKFRLFMQVTGVGDLGKLDFNLQRSYMLQFKAYLIAQKDAGTPVLEADGTDMLATVKLIG